MNALFDKQTSCRLNTTQSSWVTTHIPLDLVLRFPQVRETFDKAALQELADDFAVHGVIQPSIIFRLNERDFLRYVQITERISKKTLTTNTMPFEQTASGKYFYVLIAGERRFRAHQLLWEEGCTDCKEEAMRTQKKLKAGDCYKKHKHVLCFKKVKVNIGINQNIEQAKSVQFRENLYVKPPVEEEALSLRNYYEYLKEVDSRLSISVFAKKVGFSIEKVKKAIWFCDLPSKIKAAVKNKYVSYGNALELYRILQVQSIDHETRLRIVDAETDYLLMNPRVNTEMYRKRVKGIVESFQMPSLFDLNSLIMKKKAKRKVVAENSIKALMLYSSYVERIQTLNQEGVIGKGKLFSEQSPKKWVKKIISSVKTLTPEIAPLQPSQNQ